MKKYIKPEIEKISFEVNSSVMTEATPTPIPTLISANTYEHIPNSVDSKVWTEYGDDQNWNWE